MTPHEIRVSIYETKEQYLQLKKEWAKKKYHSAFEHTLYNILRGHDPDRGFTPITRQSRIDNGHYGAFYDQCRWRIYNILKSAVLPDMESTLKEMTNDVISFAILKRAYELVENWEIENDQT